MARPDSIHRGIGLDEGDIIPKEKSLIDLAIDKISKKSSKDFFYGTITGWASGVILVRVGRVAAFGLGGGIILLHLAAESGYISVNWDRIRAACEQTQGWVDYVIRFMKRNSCYSVGFFGGFFFGVASS
ncbi:FUN14 family domain-containing protein [Phthorimaea operculella]|nr:FUN14 family domain-containing protein [Phthorimaea operculella]